MQKETSKENDQISDEKKIFAFICSVKGLKGTIEHLTFHSLKKVLFEITFSVLLF